MMLQISSNGHVSFNREVSPYRGHLRMPIGYQVIAPFLSDVDTGLTGDVYYRYIHAASTSTQSSYSQDVRLWFHVLVYIHVMHMRCYTGRARTRRC